MATYDRAAVIARYGITPLRAGARTIAILEMPATGLGGASVARVEMLAPPPARRASGSPAFATPYER